jgi:hypothetical protein
MAQTSTAITACDVGFWLDNAAGALTDVGGSTNKVTVNLNKETLGMLRTFGSRFPTRYECGKDTIIDFNVVYSTSATEAFQILKNWWNEDDPGARTVKVYMPKKNVGADVYSGEFRLQNLPLPSEAGSSSPVMVSGQLLITGALTISTATT